MTVCLHKIKLNENRVSSNELDRGKEREIARELSKVVK